MSLLTDAQREKLKGANTRFPDVNETCIGCSACAAISETVFELDDEGLSKVKDLASYEDNFVDEAISACPVDAISWKE